jgi:LacI family transcriptional regulator
MIIPNISDPFFPTVVRGAEDALLHDGYTLIIGNSDDDLKKEEAYYENFCTKRLDGILVIVSPSERAPEYLRRHNPEVMPIVYLDRYHRGLRGDTIKLDDLGASYQAVNHLLKLGHERIAFIAGPRELLNARMRLEGYKRALTDHGVPMEESLVRGGRFDLTSGYEQTKALIGLAPRPTALFVSNALMAAGSFRALSESGLRCPDEIALVSFSDLDWFDLVRPTITAFKQPAYELGSTAAQTLVKRLTGRLTGPFRRIVLRSELVVRESTGSPRQPVENSYRSGESTFA